MTETEICPVCGRENDCGMAKGQDTCWCFVLPHALALTAPEKAGYCYCRACLTRVIADRRESSKSQSDRGGRD